MARGALPARMSSMTRAKRSAAASRSPADKASWPSASQVSAGAPGGLTGRPNGGPNGEPNGEPEGELPGAVGRGAVGVQHVDEGTGGAEHDGSPLLLVSVAGTVRALAHPAAWEKLL